MMAATEKLHPLLEKPGGTSWHIDPENFPPGTEDPGVLDISPTWFQLGHDMSS